MDKEEKELQIKLSEEERKLQIEIAQLQTNIQIWLTIFISSLAVAGASIIAEWQVLSSPSTEPHWMQGVAIAVFIIIFIIFAVLTLFSVRKMDSYKNQLDNLN